MRYIIETGTDGATLCFFNPAALPADFDENGGSSRLRAFVVKPAPKSTTKTRRITKRLRKGWPA